MDKLKREDAPIRVYKPHPANYFFIAFVGIALLATTLATIIGAIADDKIQVKILGVGLSLIFLPLHFFLIWELMLKTHHSLTIYEDGLESSIRGDSLFSRWEYLECFEIRPMRKTGSIAIYTRTIQKKHDGYAFEINGDFFISLSSVPIPTRLDGCWTGRVVDTDKLAKTEFGRELLHYAPQLFEYGKEKAKNG